MSSDIDTSYTALSKEGHIYQLEYTIKKIDNSSTVFVSCSKL